MAMQDQMIPGSNSKKLDFSMKVRKPYTITKKREKWSDEEHKNFIEGLRLYGRDWRMVENHVGSKSAVQIRSHAQKFFSKIEREPGKNEEGSLMATEIPPPRPKKKPVHPYPRKSTMPPFKTGISEVLGRTSSPPNFNVLEQQSPTSVSSSVVNSPISSLKQPRMVNHLQGSDADKESPFEPMQSFKLFGKTITQDSSSPENIILPNLKSNKVNESFMSGQTQIDKEMAQKEGSWTDSQTGPLNQNCEMEARSHRYKTKNGLKGFVPYKRCVVQRDNEDRSFRLCL